MVGAQKTVDFLLYVGELGIAVPLKFRLRNALQEFSEVRKKALYARLYLVIPPGIALLLGF